MSLVSVLERSKREKESWRYTPVEKLLAGFGRAEKKPAAAKTTKPIRQAHSPSFVFIDGVWQAEQSHFGSLPTDILQGDARKGYRLVLAGQTCLVTQPVELLFVTDNARETSVKLSIELGQSGRLTLIERHEISGSAVQMIETNIVLGPQAKLVHGKMVKSSDEQAHIATTRVTAAEGAYYDNFALIKGGKLTRNEIEAELKGPLAQCNLSGIMLLKARQHADTTTRITHAAPHGSSREIYKTVLAEQARGVFQGKIIVAEGAQKTDSRQLSRALLLSDQAEMDAKPELEIYADDVKCSHGSTVGDLDADALFYLRARGVSEEEARALLVHAFAEDIVNEIHIPEWRELCRAEIESWCHEQN